MKRVHGFYGVGSPSISSAHLTALTGWTIKLGNLDDTGLVLLSLFSPSLL